MNICSRSTKNISYNKPAHLKCNNSHYNGGQLCEMWNFIRIKLITSRSISLFFIVPFLTTLIAISLYILFVERFPSFLLHANPLFDFRYKTATHLGPVELNGRNWIPILKASSQVCINLERLIKSTGNATSEEREIWGRLNCLDALRELYGLW